jgi:hypothetical protein
LRFDMLVTVRSRVQDRPLSWNFIRSQRREMATYKMREVRK